MMIFGGGLALYLYMNLWNIRESKGYNLSHWQDLRMGHRDFPSVPKSRGLIGMFFWSPKGLSLGLEIAVAEQVFQMCSKQSASGLERYVETLQSF